MQLRATRLTAIANAVRNRFSGAALNLSFAGGTALDPRITFTRTTNATLTGSNGLIQNAPMNLLTFSEQFDNAAWTKGNATITANSTVAPNGTTTADTATATAANGVVQNTPMTITVVVDTTYTASVYVKRRTGTGVVQLSRLDGTYVTLSVTDEWQRFTVTSTASNTTGRFFIRLVTSGDAVDIWGAQLEQRSTATTYNPTTVKNLLGYTENFDNAAWTKSNAFVQTNLAINSVFANTGGAAPTGYTVGIGTGTSAPSGTASNGDTIYTQTAVAQRPFFSQNITTVVGVVYTQSIRITAASGVQVGQVLGVSGITPTYTLNGISVAVTALAASGVLTATWTATGTTSDTRYGIGGTGAATGSISFHGAQLVQGATPGDYKATYATAAAVGYTDIYGQPFAQKLVESTANSDHRVGQSVGVVGGTETFSVYAKAAERSWIIFQLGSSAVAYFNLASGTLGNVSGGTATITPVGDGWYRCSITGVRATNLNNLIFVTTGNGVVSYTGDGTSGIYIFGAQLSDSASVDPYVYQPVAAPASTAYYGPRFDYDPVTLQPKGLLIEEQRTNLLTYSEQFDNGAVWAQNSVTVTPNNTVAPDGTTTAEKLAETSTTATHVVVQAFTFLAVPYTASIFVKAAERGFALFSNGTNNAVSVDLTTGITTSAFGSPTNITSTNAGNGWYRVSFTFTPPASPQGINVYVSADGVWANRSYAGTAGSGIFVFGAQLEAGSFATSYIPTVASQVTRAADSASMIGNNFARWYNQTEGTMFAQYSVNGLNPGASNAAYGITDNTTSNFIAGRTLSSAATNFQVRTGGADQVALNSVTVAAGAVAKSAGAYALNDFSFTANAGTVQTDTSGTLPFVTQMQIGGLTSSVNPLNGHLARLAFYSRKLAPTEQQGITS